MSSHHRSPEYDAWVDRARQVPIEDELARRGIAPAKGCGKGVERKYPCPNCGGEDRFGVHTTKQTFTCHSCGAGGGGAIDLVMWLDRLSGSKDFLATVERLAGAPNPNGDGRPSSKPNGQHAPKQNGADTSSKAKDELAERERAEAQRGKAQYVYRMSRPAYGSLVETYLRSRGITCVIPATARFLPPSAKYPIPAMVWPFGIPEEDGPDLDIAASRITAIHLTYLKEDGSGKAEVDLSKIVIAARGGMPIVISPIGKTGELIIVEGIEDALTLHQVLPGIGVWAASSAGAMPHLADKIPEDVAKLVLYEDANAAGRRGSRGLAQKVYTKIKVFLENDGGAAEYPDANAVLLKDGEDAVRARHQNAREYDPKRDVMPGPVNAKQASGGVSLDDFRAYLPMHNYIYVPSREPWPAASVNAKCKPIVVGHDEKTNEPIKISASTWLDQNKSVEQMTWAPGKPMLILDRLVSEGGWIEHAGVTCFNLYRPPTIKMGDAGKAAPWLDLVKKIYPNEAEHLIKWCAFKVQHPEIKINHAIVLGGAQGIGKDTFLEPVKRAIGPWNFKEVSPEAATGRFNGFLKSVILRISEARDTGDVNRYQLYEHLKTYTAAPPDVLRVDEKNLREHAVFNCCGVVITTNHKSDGIYLPADDRRHYVAWSDCRKEDFTPAYWSGLWTWYDRDGGDQHVAAYLNGLDVTGFDPKEPPPKTPAFWAIVDANRAPEDAELADVLDAMGNPDVTTLTLIRADNACSTGFEEWLKDIRSRRVIPHRMESCGYVQLRNDGAKDGLWKLGGKRQVVYAKASLSLKDQRLALKHSGWAITEADAAGQCGR